MTPFFPLASTGASFSNRSLKIRIDAKYCSHCITDYSLIRSPDLSKIQFDKNYLKKRVLKSADFYTRALGIKLKQIETALSVDDDKN